MPRKLLFRTDTLPYHVTARANNRENFHMDMEWMWKKVSSECRSIRLLYDVEFHAFVLMPNHFHMILTVPHEDLGIVMNRFISELTRMSNRASGRSGHLFGAPYHWSVINSSRYFGHALKYVYRNPVKARLCKTVEDYPFSTLSGLLGRSHLPFPIHFSRVGLELVLPGDEPATWLPWLNRPFPHEAEDLIRKGLKRRVFQTAADSRTRRDYEILNQLV